MIEPSLPERLQRLVAQIQELESDPGTRGRIGDLVQTILDLHGTALARLLDLIAREDEAGRMILESAAQDHLVRSLLLLHNLHPVDLETRIGQAFDQVRPFLCSQGADVELVAVAEEAVRLRLHRSGGYSASLQTLRAAIEEAIGALAPDVRLIEFVEPGEPGNRPSVRLPLPVLA